LGSYTLFSCYFFAFVLLSNEDSGKFQHATVPYKESRNSGGVSPKVLQKKRIAVSSIKYSKRHYSMRETSELHVSVVGII
jgi:hypothetical protein